MKRSVLKLTASLLLAAALFAGPVMAPALAEDTASAPSSSQQTSTPDPTPIPQEPGTASPQGAAYVVAATVTDVAGAKCPP